MGKTNSSPDMEIVELTARASLSRSAWARNGWPGCPMCSVAQAGEGGGLLLQRAAGRRYRPDENCALRADQGRFARPQPKRQKRGQKAAQSGQESTKKKKENRNRVENLAIVVRGEDFGIHIFFATLRLGHLVYGVCYSRYHGWCTRSSLVR